MASIIKDGKLFPVKVVFVGQKIQIWTVDGVYTIFIGDKSITVTDEDERELLTDIAQLSPDELDEKWFESLNEFLNSL